ncbi:hypothetical protein TI04_05825 [Achromatium sp. WMS2]|nr:hypothetical protein TI04_05825 [Achromatium sp. WMS2]
MKDLPNDIAFLKKIIHQLLEKNAKLEAEIAELRRRLGLDSTNSHKPPSSNGYKKFANQPAIPKEGKCANCGQKGHKGKILERVAQPDHIEVHLPGQCQCCGRWFQQGNAHAIVQTHQVSDLPAPRLKVTEYQVAQIKCCGILHCGEYPPHVTVLVQYGPNTKAFVSKLSIDHKIQIEQISQLFADMYDYNLNSPTILEILNLGYELAASIEHQLIENMLKKIVINFDETGIRVGGKLRWLHTASTEEQTHIFVHKKRRTETLKSTSSILKDFKGKAVHDCWKPYFAFEEASHFLCSAHLLRELNGLAENDSLWALKMHALLLDLHKTPRLILQGEDDMRARYTR